MARKIRKDIIIKCPHCGYEYLPCEIFYPDKFLGKCWNIERDEDGRIMCYDGFNMDRVEEYVCDKCGHTFKITYTTHFASRKCKEHDFNYDYKTIIRENK